MPILSRLKTFLDEHLVPYLIIAHPEAYTAQEVAAALHRSGKRLAKVVMVKAGERFVMCVLPAHELIDMGRLEKILGNGQEVRLATEEEFQTLFPDCEVGAMPPFGNLYHLPVYMDERLTQYKEIYFEGGSHTETVALALKDFKRLVSPHVALFGKVLHTEKAA